MGKNKPSKFFQGKEAFQRMNFIYQASEYVMKQTRNQSLAAYYGFQMTSICKKSVLRMEPSVKRQLCKGCRALLVPGISSKARLTSSPKNLVMTCLQCGTLKRFPMNPQYRVWTETPEACFETFTTGLSDSSIEGSNGKQTKGTKSVKLSTTQDIKLVIDDIKQKQRNNKPPQCSADLKSKSLSENI